MNWVTWVITTTLLFMPFMSNGVDGMGKTTYKLTTPDGAVYYFSEPDCVVNIGIPEGFGLPTLDHNAMTVYKQPGALLTGIQIKPRIVTITATLSGSCRLALHQARAALFSALRWNRTNTDPPPSSTLTYAHDGKSVNLKVHYLSDVTNSQGETADVIGVRLIAYDPMWYATSSTTTALALSQNLNVNYFVGLVNGEWNTFGIGTDATVRAAVVAPDGTLYIGGLFTNADGVLVNHVARWNGTTFEAMGGAPGLTGGDVYALAVAANGDVYAAGSFNSHTSVARWDGAAWNDVGPAGADATVYSLAIGPDGTVYAGGGFSNIGGVACNRIAKWNGAVWLPLGTGMPAGIVYALEFAPNGNLYAGGTFTVANGVTVNRVTYWNGTTFVAMGATPGANSDVYALAVGPDGSVYAGGDFSTLGGIAMLRIGRWNGVSWNTMGVGMNAAVFSLAILSSGLIYAGGAFTQAGGVLLADHVAMWTGTAWAPIDIDLPGAPNVYGLDAVGNDLYIGFDTAGVATASDNTTVANLGNVDAYPVISITGPGRLRYIVNRTTGKMLLFNYLQLNTGETVTVDLSPGVKTITSDWRGNMMPYAPLLPLSDMGTFVLVPDPIVASGNNVIMVFMTNTTGASLASLVHYNAYLTADDAVR